MKAPVGGENKGKNMSFMDTFYGLASSSGLERATAATALVQHIVVSSSKEDGKYAFQRLCKGLCSGRASARQGYASCLSTLIKLSLSPESSICWYDDDQNVLVWLREQLLHYTSPSGHNASSPKRGGEDRDYKFGRLFGILAMIRSGTLSSKDTPSQLICDYMNDLIGLYKYKSWLREPAVKAMMDLTSSCHADNEKVLIPQIIVPFLTNDDPYNQLSAEQLALLWYVQAKPNISQLSPYISNKKNLLTPQTFSSPELLLTLRDTCSVVHPRCHIVWKALWENLKSIEKEESKNSILNSLVDNFLFPHLLCESISTHERRALALVLIWQIFTNFQLGDKLLQPRVVDRAFLCTIKFSKKKKNLLEPLARFVLQNMVDHALQQDQEQKSTTLRWDLISHLQLGIAQAKSQTQVLNFDVATKTNTIQTLLGLQQQNQQEKKTHHQNLSSLWEHYVKLLQTELQSSISSKADHMARSYVDILYNFAKRVSHYTFSNDDKSTPASTATKIVQSIASQFLVQGCMDITNMAHAKSSKEKKKKKKKLDNIHLLVQTATDLKDKSKGNLIVPYEVRLTMSSRLHSLLSDCKMEMVEFVCEGWQDLQKSLSVTAWCQKNDNEDRNDIKNIVNSSSSTSLVSVNQLIKALYLNLLSPGQNKDDQEEKEDPMDEDEDEDEDDIEEDVNEVIRDLSEVIAVFHKEGNDANPLQSLVQIFIHILSSHFCNSTNFRAGSCKLIRDCVKAAWTESIAELPNKENVDGEVMTSLLEAVCGSQTMEETMHDDDDDDGEEDVDSDDDAMEDDDAEAVFVSAANLNLDDEEENSNGEEKMEEKDISDEEKDDVELDQSRLESMLLEDSDVEIDGEGGVLEHHAGADKALAQLIKLKQDSRKAGAEARERQEFATRLRCIVLLESIFSSKNNSVLSNQVVLMSTLPLIRARRVLDKSIQASKDGLKSSQVGLSVKRSLLDRIDSLLRKNIFKVKLPGNADIEGCTTLANKIIEEIQKSPNTTHTSLCSLALVLVMKAVDSNHGVELTKTIYVPALEEWSNNKRAKVTASIFDDLLLRFPSLARVTMTKSLSLAANTSVSPYLKSECFRMLSDVYNIKQKQSSDSTLDTSLNGTLVKDSLDVLNNEAVSTLKAIEVALQDDDLIKSKRIRDVLKACETTVAFISESVTNREARISLEILSSPLKLLTESSASSNVKDVCTKLKNKILEIVKTQQEADAEMAARELLATPSQTPSSKSTSKSTKKKKKKKSKR